MSTGINLTCLIFDYIVSYMGFKVNIFLHHFTIDCANLCLTVKQQEKQSKTPELQCGKLRASKVEAEGQFAEMRRKLL